MYLFSRDLVFQHGGTGVLVVDGAQPVVGVADAHAMIGGHGLVGMHIDCVGLQIDDLLVFGGDVLDFLLGFLQALGQSGSHFD